MRRPTVLALAVGCALSSARADGGAELDPGPALGARLPPLGLPDQTGRERSFEDLRGPNGLLLLVFRSADW